MKKNGVILLCLLFIVMVTVDAKIIEVDQLFNRSIVQVKEKSISIKKTFYGQTVIDETKMIDINTRFNGFIEELYANKTYQEVNTTVPLLTLYSDELIALQEELLLSKNNKKLYTSTLNRLKALDIDSRVIQRIKDSDTIMEHIPLYSPINGYIVTKNVDQNSAITKGKTLFKIASLNQLWVIAKVYQKDLSFIEKGMKATITIKGLSKTIEAKVDYIYPNVDPKTQTVDVRLVIENRNTKLFPNMFAKIELFKQQKTRLVLPRSAVLIKGDQHYVFKPINQNQFEPIAIEAKRLNAKEFEIIDGLEKGDRVIDQAMFMLDSEAMTNGLYDRDDEEW